MNNMQRLTITLTPEIADAVHAAVSGGDYASSSELIREALRDWRIKRGAQQQELEALRANIRLGDADRAAGRVHDFDPERIIRKGGQKLAVLAPSE